jgi:uncharacterized protein involved in exopolysaccharide biosynthesis
MDTNVREIQEDEIDLRELARTIGKYKWKLIVFVIIVTMLSVLWSLSKPNVYKSQAVLVPQEASKSASLGGLGALAGMAGLDLGGSEMSPDGAYQLYLDDYQWSREFLLKTKLFDKINSLKADENYRFALGIRGIYDAMHSKPEVTLADATAQEREKMLFETYQTLKTKLSIAADKKTSVITIAYSDPDGELARDVVKQFLSHASTTLRTNELSDMNKKVDYYANELRLSEDLALKTQLSQLMSALIQKRVLAQSSDLYNVKVMVAPSVAYERDKEGPKRGLIVVVSMVTSLILGIFGIFLLEFIRKPKEDESL